MPGLCPLHAQSVLTATFAKNCRGPPPPTRWEVDSDTWQKLTIDHLKRTAANQFSATVENWSYKQLKITELGYSADTVLIQS